MKNNTSSSQVCTIMTNTSYKVIIFLLLVYVYSVVGRHRGRARGSCDTTTCCPSKTCQLSGTGRAKCSYARTCDQLQCPAGFVCGPHRHHTPKKTTPKNFTRTKHRVECKVSCDAVNCPGFLECREKGHGYKSYAVCKLPRRCSDVVCPVNTTCRGARRSPAVCIADSCDGIDCGANAVCRSGEVSIRAHTKSRNTKGYTHGLRHFLRALKRLRGKRSNSRSYSDSKSHSHSNHTRRARVKQSITIATCAPQCTNTTCPFGLVCEELTRKLEVRCRAPRNCDELTCPAGQECQIIGCGKYSNLFTPKSKKKGKYIVQCVDIVNSTSPTVSSIQLTSSVEDGSTTVAQLTTSIAIEASTTVVDISTTVGDTSTTVIEVSTTTAIDTTSAEQGPTSQAGSPTPSPESPTLSLN